MFIQNYYYIYILASDRNGTLDIGVTNNPLRRIAEYKNHIHSGFTKNYSVTKLVYLEKFDDIDNAIHREKILKEWQRNWKKDLIEKTNPEWNDLYETIQMLI